MFVCLEITIELMKKHKSSSNKKIKIRKNQINNLNKSNKMKNKKKIKRIMNKSLHKIRHKNRQKLSRKRNNVKIMKSLILMSKDKNKKSKRKMPNKLKH